MAADSRWIFLHLIIFLVFGEAAGDEQEYRLTRYLLSNYDASVRPADNNSLPLRVTFGISLHHIIDVDEKNQILTTNCWLTSIWTDHHLKWNASDFAGIKVVRIPYHRVWRPDVILYNNADAQYSAAVINTNVIVSSSGEVVWLSHGIYRSSCDINVEYFPFDVQSCQMKWASWTYDGYQLALAIFTIAIALSEAGYHGWSGGGGGSGGGGHGGGGGGHGGGSGGHGGGGGGHGGGGGGHGGGGYGGGGHGGGGGGHGGGGGGHGGGGGGHGGGGYGGGGGGKGHGGGGGGGGSHGGGGGGHGGGGGGHGGGGGGHGGGGGGHGGGGGGGGGGGKKCYCYC